jgi:CHAT domain-containing protein
VPLTTGKLIASVLFVSICLPCVPQQKPDSEKRGADAIAKAREALHQAEAEHPGNTVEVVDALNRLVGTQIEARAVNAGTLAEVTREVQMAEAAAGAQSETFVSALEDQVEVLVRLSRDADARPVAERCLEIAQKNFPGTAEAAAAADEVGLTCSRLGDYPCALQTYEMALAIRRKIGGNDNPDLIFSYNHLGQLKSRMGDLAGSIQADEEALALTYRLNPNDHRLVINENNLCSRYIKAQQFDKAREHLDRAIALAAKDYGPGSPMDMQVHAQLANLLSRTGQFPEAWKDFDFSLKNRHDQVDMLAGIHFMFGQSLAQGGDPVRAVEEGLTSERMSRELFVLQARTLPERQALAYDASRPYGLGTAISVVLKHPELPSTDVYQEVVRSRALVADEMARRQKNLNATNDPEVARLLAEMKQARTDLLATEQAPPSKLDNRDARGDAIVESTNRMEKIERELAEHSADLRDDERAASVRIEDLRHRLPAHSALISYVTYRRIVVDKVDPASSLTPAYMAFVLVPNSDRIRVFDLGDAKPIEDLVNSARASADTEAHAGGMGSIRNERMWREAGEALRKIVWDPLRAELGDAKLALVVPDGVLNLIPFGGLPDGKGYLVEHGPVIHILGSERDLVPAEVGAKKAGLLAVGGPSFELARVAEPPSPLRDASVACEEFSKLEFHPLPGSGAEVADLSAAWRRWNGNERSALLTGAEATRSRFIEDASQNRVLHIATHAFLLDKSCGNGNPLLESGLVFAGANQSRDASILTAQQIASLDLRGVDWAVLSACNTGNGELHDGEGVLGLQRAFRIAGARSVVMTLWSVDDDVTRRFMHELYAERLGLHASTADAVWTSARKLLRERRAAGKSTHPWYWAGFVGSGAWE